MVEWVSGGMPAPDGSSASGADGQIVGGAMLEAPMTKGSASFHLLTLVISGAAGRIRTHDPLVRSQVLYPTELQPPRSETIAGIFDLMMNLQKRI
jgi:hypothetical protein